MKWFRRKPKPDEPVAAPSATDVMFETVMALLEHPEDWTEHEHYLMHASSLKLWTANKGTPVAYRVYDQQNYPDIGATPSQGCFNGNVGDVWWTSEQIEALGRRIDKLRRDKRLLEGKPIDRHERAVQLLKAWAGANPGHRVSELIDVL